MTAPAADQLTLAAGMVRLTHLVQGVFTEVAARRGLPPAQARLLCILAAQPRGMAELSGILGVEKAALTGLVDRIEQRGLAERKPVPGDRRALRVTLTAAGEQAAITVHDEISAEVVRLADALPGPDREHFRALLGLVVTANAAPPVFPDPGIAADHYGQA
jgi:DNA-binding MarR family transcriptional regulator